MLVFMLICDQQSCVIQLWLSIVCLFCCWIRNTRSIVLVWALLVSDLPTLSMIVWVDHKHLVVINNPDTVFLCDPYLNQLLHTIIG